MSPLKRGLDNLCTVADDGGEGTGREKDENASSASPSPSPFVCLPMYGEHKRAVSSVRLSPSRLTKQNSALCASASADGCCKIWDLGDDLVDLDSSYSNNGGSRAADSGNNRGEYPINPISTLVGHSRGINDVCWSLNGIDPFVATASDDKTIRLWDAQTSDALVEFRGHDNFVFCCQFNPASNLIVSGSFDETVKLWDVRSGECVTTLPAHSDSVTAVCFNRDGTCVVSASHDGLIRVWDVGTGECLKTVYAPSNPPVSHVRFSPNGKYVLAGTLDNALRLWPMSVSGKAKCAKTYTSEYHTNTKYCIASQFCVSKRRQCIITGSETGHLILYDVQSRRVHQLLEQVHKDVVLAVDAHDGIELLASGGMSKDRTVRFWMPKIDLTEKHFKIKHQDSNKIKKRKKDDDNESTN